MKCCAIVDGCSTGKYLVKHLKSCGYSCVHIQSSEKQPAVARNDLDVEDYRTNLTFKGDYSTMASLLKTYRPDFVIAGSEPGVELANKLSEDLDLFSNARGVGRHCRDKFSMSNVINSQGLQAVKQKRTSDLYGALSWARHCGCWPLVIKPNDSGGGDGFYVCNTEVELERAFLAVLGTKNIFDKVNEDVLIQEFVQGEEYVVNTISYNSKHYVDSIMKARKQQIDDGRLAYDFLELLPQEDVPELSYITKYTFSVLDALGIKYGPTHDEIIMSERGPIMIDCGARVMGTGIPPKCMTECLGHSQVELTVLAYTNPKAFLKYIDEPYKLRKHMLMVFLISRDEGIIDSLRYTEEIKKMSSFSYMHLSVSAGDVLKKTVDLPTSPGMIVLSHNDKDSMIEDYHRIRIWEDEGLFALRI